VVLQIFEKAAGVENLGFNGSLLKNGVKPRLEIANGIFEMLKAIEGMD
jgi:hypothetical protein